MMTLILSSNDGDGDPTRKGKWIMRRGLVLACLVVMAPTLSGEHTLAEQPSSEGALDIGSRLELFLDEYLIESMEGVSLKLHEPRSAGKVLTFDQPWEGNLSIALGLLRHNGAYRLYYRGTSLPEYLRPSGLRPGEVMVPEHPGVFCYAESSDGIHWSRPSLGMYEFQGSKDNNVILEGGLGHPLLDPNPTVDPSERYKATTYRRLSEKSHGLFLWVSGDGIHWRKWRQEPLFTSPLPNAFDGNQNPVFWWEPEGQYVCFFRYMLQGVRSIVKTTSKDLLNWSEQVPADFGNTPLENFYVSAAHPYFRAPHILLGFPKRLVKRRKYHLDTPHPGISDGIFMSSRDGVHWKRFMEAFIRPGRDERNWIHRTTFTVPGVIRTAPDEISLFVSRNYTYPSAHLERMTLRIDGYVSLNADYTGVEFITKPLIFQGHNLVLNFATSAAGSIRLEIQDINGNPLPGFALEESPLIWGDEIEHTVQWERTHAKATSAKPLARIAGKPVRLRFAMKDADLYSLRFR